MSDILNGNQANVTTPLTASVSAIASGAGGVWLVTTAAPHLFGPNDYVHLQVTISAVAVDAYGTITVIDATHFSVAGTTFAATGTGTATDLSLTPQILVPTDGDSFSLQLSGMLSSQQGILDRTQALRYMQLWLGAVDVQEFTGNGTWTPPVWIQSTSIVDVEVVGDGGGGGGGAANGFNSTAIYGGSGGGGGGRSRRVGTYADWGSPATLPVVVGQGGAAGTGAILSALAIVAGNTGGPGTGSSVGTVAAGGGGGGVGGFSGTPPTAGSTGIGGTGDFPGGNGGVPAAATNGGSAPTSAGASGGGSGAGITSGVAYSGGNGGAVQGSSYAGASGGITGGPGAAGHVVVPAGAPGLGGGGGASSASTVGGAGGAPSNYGGGGGGGGCAVAGNGGVGPAGARGSARVITRR